MNRTRRSILALAILVSVASHAQEATIENVLRSRSRGSGTIMKNNELAGYWNFYQVDREDSKNNSFRMARQQPGLRRRDQDHAPQGQLPDGERVQWQGLHVPLPER